MNFIQIIARETSTSQRLSSTAVVNIMIVNENDGTPSFPETMYTFRINENLPPQALVSTTPAGLSAILVSMSSHVMHSSCLDILGH